MKKYLALLAMFITSGVFADSLDMNNLYCKNVKFNSSTTLSDVQNACVVKKQSKHDGMFEVELVNEATNKKVKCDFPSNQPNALLNGCRSAGIF